MARSKLPHEYLAAALLAAAGLMGHAGPAPAQGPDRPSEPAARLAAPHRLVLDSAVSHVWFDGTSTFGAFSATTSSLDGWTELQGDALAGARGVVRLQAATLHTGIGLRDRHLRQELDTDRFPLITLTVDDVSTSAAVSGGAIPVVIRGALTVKGQTHPVSFGGTAALRGDTLTVDAKTPLTFTGLGMKPPTRMFGTTRVHDDFLLRFQGRFLRPRS